MFKCILISKNGYIRELFYRAGSSKKDILSDLEFFQWPEGVWKIEAVEGWENQNF